MKIVINTSYGGLSLSDEGVRRYFEIKKHDLAVEIGGRRGYKDWDYSYYKVNHNPDAEEDIEWLKSDRGENVKKYLAEPFSEHDIPRDDQALIQLVEEDAKLYSGRGAELKVVEIPDDIQYTIEGDDCAEWVAEVHRTWR